MHKNRSETTTSELETIHDSPQGKATQSLKRIWKTAPQIIAWVQSTSKWASPDQQIE